MHLYLTLPTPDYLVDLRIVLQSGRTVVRSFVPADQYLTIDLS